jgi:flagellar hook assembly protein FlgD
MGGEQISLRAFDADAGLVYSIAETLTFEGDKVEGSVHEPVVLTAGAVWTDEVLPAVFALGRNCPNPFNATTKIAYDIPAGGGRVTLRIYDVAGRLVRTLADGVETPGRKTAIWDGKSNRGQRVASGVYFYRMTAPGFEKTSRMVMMK